MLHRRLRSRWPDLGVFELDQSVGGSIVSKADHISPSQFSGRTEDSCLFSFHYIWPEY